VFTQLTDSGLRLVLHGPDDVSARSAAQDSAFEGLIDYAAEAGAELVVLHGLNLVEADGAGAAPGPHRPRPDARQSSGQRPCLSK
jgi:hypothetical protein